MAPTKEDLLGAAQRLGFQIKEKDAEEYGVLLSQFDVQLQKAMTLEPFKLPTYAAEFPRVDVRAPVAEENKLGGWAWKATVTGAKDGILSGKTFCLKDTICLADVPCLFGTNAIKDFVPTVDATVVTRILQAGGTIVGKAVCEDMSHGAISFSSCTGPVHNPYAYGFSTGGSSSGCGALIGSGEVDAGIGGDQGGSVRIPASLCGLVGLKPTFGLMPYTGVLSSESGVDHVGPMARTVVDCAALLQATAGYDGIDDRQLGAPTPALVPRYLDELATSTGIKGLRVGILVEGLKAPTLQPEVHSLFKEAVVAFEKLGAIVSEISVPLHRESLAAMSVINKLGATQTRQGRQCSRRGYYLNDYFEKLLPWNQDKWDVLKPFVINSALNAEYGWKEYPLAYGHSMNVIRRLKDEYDEALAEVDVLIMPTISFVARKHPENATPLKFHQIGGTSKKLMPQVQKIVGKLWDDATILKVGHAWENANDWKSNTIRLPN